MHYTSVFHNSTSSINTIFKSEMTLLSLKALKIYVNHNMRVFLVRNHLFGIEVGFNCVLLHSAKIVFHKECSWQS